MAEKVEIEIAVLNKAVKSLRELERQLDDVADESGKAAEVQTVNWRGLLTVWGSIVAAGYAVKKALDFAEEGAQAAQTAASFDLLLDHIGAAPDLLQRLNSVADGTISQLELMSATSTLLAGAQGDLATNLANSTPELLKIARAANKLNPSLGDTSFLYQSLATGIKRASPMILDNLGLTIKVGEANERYAEELGKTVEQLTAEEQKQALLNETLRAGQVLIEQVGGDVSNMADSYAQLATEIENATNRTKENLDVALRPMVENLLEGVRVINRTAEASRILGGEIVNRGRDFRLTSGEIITLEEALERADQASDAMAHTWNKDFVEAMNSAVDSTADLSSAHENLNLSMESIKIGIDGQIGEAWEDYKEMTRRSGETLDDFIERQKDAREAINDTTRDLIFQTVAKGLDEEATLNLARSMGILSEEDYAVAEASRILREHFDLMDGQMDGSIEHTDLMSEAAATLAERLAGIESPDEIQIIVDTFMAEQGLGNFQEMLNNLPQSVRIDLQTNILSQGTLAGRASGGPVRRGVPYVVGEKRPELFIPYQDGEILPYVPSGAGASGGIGGTQLVVQLQYSPTVSLADQRDVERILPMLERGIRRIVEQTRL